MEEFSATEIWKTAKELFGFPVTWQISTHQIIELKQTLTDRRLDV